MDGIVEVIRKVGHFETAHALKLERLVVGQTPEECSKKIRALGGKWVLNSVHCEPDRITVLVTSYRFRFL